MSLSTKSEIIIERFSHSLSYSLISYLINIKNINWCLFSAKCWSTEVFLQKKNQVTTVYVGWDIQWDTVMFSGQDIQLKLLDFDTSVWSQDAVLHFDYPIRFFHSKLEIFMWKLPLSSIKNPQPPRNLLYTSCTRQESQYMTKEHSPQSFCILSIKNTSVLAAVFCAYTCFP